MHKIINNLIEIKKEIYLKNMNNNLIPKIIAVSKTFIMNEIIPLIDYGHTDFGENKVQEAIDKWSKIKTTNKDIKLHMIGKLQTNKVKQAVSLFDYIHSVDSIKLAEKICKEQKKINKSIKLFIQINLGNEDQKNGIEIENFADLYLKCKNDLKLDVIGIMCIPPVKKDSSIFFQEMKKIAEKFSIEEISMGMSSDYLKAIEYNSTFVRIGSKIFGERS
ncbi:YggS family pyridoxal phosphate-dependent enzyme [Pelagibacterales bacterium SAG-MED01]|nr:YggS family pyridoxal phosphate-dependent enzyme [Pelagibacterales bacterium SAG-MED01]